MPGGCYDDDLCCVQRRELGELISPFDFRAPIVKFDVIAKRYEIWCMAFDLLLKNSFVGAGGQPHDPEPLRKRRDDVQSARSDRAG